MGKLVILVIFAFALVAVYVKATRINICGEGGSCCPKNSSLKCCCETNIIHYQASLIKANFWKANILCKQSNMDLATITSQAEENALTAYLKSLSNAVGFAAGFWIGATNIMSNSGYYWLKTGEPMVYSAFLPTQPDNLGSEHCVEWLIGNANPNSTGWNDYDCNQQLNYVCQSRKRCI